MIVIRLQVLDNCPSIGKRLVLSSPVGEWIQMISNDIWRVAGHTSFSLSSEQTRLVRKRAFSQAKFLRKRPRTEFREALACEQALY